MKALIWVLSFVLPLSSVIAAEPKAEAFRQMVIQAYLYADQSAFVFDLDETLVDSTPRRFAATQDVVAKVCAREPAHPDCPALRAVTLRGLYQMQNRYDEEGYLRLAGVQDEAMIERVSRETFARYLSGDYILEEDRLYAGAREFVLDLKKRNAKVFFVSSRSIERQYDPTLEFLKRRGLLADGEENLLYLKPDSERSLDFKRRAVQAIGRRMKRVGGQVDGIFENEPENISAWVQVFPRAKAFFVEGAYQHEGPIPMKAVLLRDFRY